MVQLPSASAEEVERLVVNPLEGIVREIPGIDHTYAVAINSLAIVNAQFKVGEDKADSLIKLYDRVLGKRNQLPADASTTPLIKSIDVDDAPIITVTLGADFLFDPTINHVTLFALILSLGLLVDAAIVVIENIHRHYNHLGAENKQEATISATNEIGNPTNLATFAVMLVFASLILISGMSGQYFYPVAFNVPIAIFASLLAAYIVTPWAANRWLKLGEGKNLHSDNQKDRLHVFYHWIITPLLDKRWLRYLLSLIIVVLISLSLLQPAWQFIRSQGRFPAVAAFHSHIDGGHYCFVRCSVTQFIVDYRFRARLYAGRHAAARSNPRSWSGATTTHFVNRVGHYSRKRGYALRCSFWRTGHLVDFWNHCLNAPYADRGAVTILFLDASQDKCKRSVTCNSLPAICRFNGVYSKYLKKQTIGSKNDVTQARLQLPMLIS